MIKILIISLILILSNCGTTEVDKEFERYLWHNRVLLIFAPDVNSPLLKKQQEIIKINKKGMDDRDLVIWLFIYGKHVKVNNNVMPHLPTQRFYQRFNISKKNFHIILIGKDGEQKISEIQKIISKKELFSLIDAMPMRRHKIRHK